jgi:hypothetical protein
MKNDPFENSEVLMTSDEREQMTLLFERIAREQNVDKFIRWVEQLNEILNRKQQRMKSEAERTK